jgi:hypothetical protein
VYFSAFETRLMQILFYELLATEKVQSELSASSMFKIKVAGWSLPAPCRPCDCRLRRSKPRHAAVIASSVSVLRLKPDSTSA